LENTQKIVDDGNQVLILLPEVLLATQLIERFRKRLKNCVIAEWNSSLTPKKKAIIWHGVLSGNIDVVVGARSALFLPFKNLKLIIIDEENDSSFKQEEGIVYNARDMAIMKAKIEKIPILLSTATPSAESYYNTILGKYKISINRMNQLHHIGETAPILIVTHPTTKNFLNPAIAEISNLEICINEPVIIKIEEF